MRTEIQNTELYQRFKKALEITDMRPDDNPFVVECCKIAKEYADKVKLGESDIIGVDVIIRERKRQITVEKYTTEHDDQHSDGSIAQVASIYAMPTDKRDMWNKIPNNWPWENEFWKPTPKDRIKELTKAGALIVAEIERLKRLAAK